MPSKQIERALEAKANFPVLLLLLLLVHFRQLDFFMQIARNPFNLRLRMQCIMHMRWNAVNFKVCSIDQIRASIIYMLNSCDVWCGTKKVRSYGKRRGRREIWNRNLMLHYMTSCVTAHTEERCNAIVCASNIDIHTHTSSNSTKNIAMHTTNVNYRFGIQLSLFRCSKMPPVFNIWFHFFEPHQICMFTFADNFIAVVVDFESLEVCFYVYKCNPSQTAHFNFATLSFYARDTNTYAWSEYVKSLMAFCLYSC